MGQPVLKSAPFTPSGSRALLSNLSQRLLLSFPLRQMRTKPCRSSPRAQEGISEWMGKPVKCFDFLRQTIIHQATIIKKVFIVFSKKKVKIKSRNYV